MSRRTNKYIVVAVAPTSAPLRRAQPGPRRPPGTACQADVPVLVGGGPTGGTIDLLEEGLQLTASDSGSEGIYYRRFDTTTNSFGVPVARIERVNRRAPGPRHLRGQRRWRLRDLVRQSRARALVQLDRGHELAYIAARASAIEEFLVGVDYSHLGGG